MMQSDQCGICRHYITEGACRAFPDGIPTIILDGEADHREPFAGDNGIRFEPLTQVPAEAVSDVMDLEEEDEGREAEDVIA